MKTNKKVIKNFIKKFENVYRLTSKGNKIIKFVFNVLKQIEANFYRLTHANLNISLSSCLRKCLSFHRNLLIAWWLMENTKTSQIEVIK